MTSDSDHTDATLAKVRRHIRILVDLGKYAGSNTDIRSFMGEAVRQISRAVEIGHVKIMRYRRQHADLLVEAGVGWKPGVIGAATLSASLRSPPGRAFQTAEPVVIPNFSEQTEYEISSFLREHHIVALSNTPILVDGAAWGVVEVDSTSPRAFGKDTSEFLTAVGTLIGALVRRSELGMDGLEETVTAIAEAKTRNTLMREMQHRVKNNFQLILSSIAIQKRRYLTREAQRALDHIASRISAISLAHDQLAVGEKHHSVKLPDYLRSLCGFIRQQAENIEIEMEADDISVAIDRAVPLGLILNEVATNSIKHAFGGGPGRVSVRLLAGVGYSEGRLIVADNGKGLGEKKAGGSGLKLVTALARQIGGTLKQESSENGTIISVDFPVII